MNTSRYRAFVAVAHHGSLSAAARALGVSQPSVSGQISTLERQSRVELFHRRGYRMTLSDAGQKLLAIAQKLLTLESEAEFLLRDSGQLNQGILKLGAVGPFHVTEMVAAYRERFPGMHISIRMGNSQQVLHDLENYATDIAVLAGQYKHAGLLSIPYACHPIILFAPRSHPLARFDSVPIHALQGVQLIQREQGSTTRAALENALQAAQVQARTDIEIGSREAIREAVARGLGVGAVSEAEFIADARYKPLRIQGDPATTSTYVYVLKERFSSVLLRSFMTATGLQYVGDAAESSHF